MSSTAHDFIYAYCMGFGSIRLITFDCYGTLIHWEDGMLSALRPMLSHATQKIADEEILAHYGEVEAELEAGPYLPYRAVLAQVAQGIGQRTGIHISEDDGRAFAESLTRWKPFPDTVTTLQLLAKKFRLAILSNIDDDLFAETRKMFAPVEFAFVVTAQQMQAYKPALKNFEEAIRRSGLSNDQILHVGQSIYHDIEPANILGIQNVWVNRPSIRPGVGPVKIGKGRPTHEVHSLAELAALVGATSA
jgi:2-haloacid dehalogenase